MSFLRAEASKSITVISAVASVTIDSDKDLYVEGESARFFGYVRDAAGVGIGNRWVYVSIPTLLGYVIGQARTNSGGYWEVSWVIPWTVVVDLTEMEVPGGLLRVQAECAGLTAYKDVVVAWRSRISISAPGTVKEDEAFTVSGFLEFESWDATAMAPMWKPLGYQTVNVYYNNTLLGTDVDTDVNTGAYSVSASIPAEGTYTLKVVFEGAGAALGAYAVSTLRVGLPLDRKKLLSIILLALLAAGVAYSVTRR